MYDVGLFIGRVTYAVLLGYFVSKVVSAVIKLHEDKIGTSVRKVITDTVLYPSVTACPFASWENIFDASLDPAAIPRSGEKTLRETLLWLFYWNINE